MTSLTLPDVLNSPIIRIGLGVQAEASLVEDPPPTFVQPSADRRLVHPSLVRNVPLAPSLSLRWRKTAPISSLL